MATALKLRRGTTVQHSSFTGEEGEVTVDTTKDTLVVHDGVTAGGVPLAKETGSTVAVAAGTVSAPGLTTTGDTNTGIFFPAADTIAFAEGGAEAMRITDAGSVGIGTTTPNLTAITKAVTVSANGSGEISAVELQGNRSASGQTSGLIRFYNNTDAITQLTGVRGTNSNDGLLTFSTASSGTLTERMRIDSSGNVGIGTTSPSGALQITKSADDNLIIRDDRTVASFDTFDNSMEFQEFGGTVIAAVRAQHNGFVGGSARALKFEVNTAERMRIDSSGNVFVGGTSQNTANGIIYSKTNAKAWVRFNGSAITVTASHNVSSVTRINTGIYSFSFTSALTDGNWCGVSSTSDTSGSFGVLTWVNTHSTTGGRTYSVNLGGTYYNDTAMQVIIFGN